MMGSLSFDRRVAVCALAVVSGLLLTGCAAQQGTLTDLQRDHESGDEMPQLDDHAYEAVDVESSRFVGEHEGISLWLAEGREDSAVCLVADPGDADWVVGCGGLPIGVDGIAGHFEVVPDGAPAPEGATQISKNVYAW